MQDKRDVLTNSSTYGADRSFSDIPLRRYRIVRRRDLCWAEKWCRRAMGQGGFSMLRDGYFRDFGLYRGELVHLYNGIVFSGRPWTATFERTLPYLRGGHISPFVRKAVEAISLGNCRHLVATSNWAATMQKEFVGRLQPELMEVVAEKMSVMHFSQQSWLKHYDQKLLDSACIQLVMVGSQFYRKGGREVVRVVSRLLEEGASIRLVLVTRIRNEPGSRVTEEEHAGTLELIRRAGGRIQVLGRISDSDLRGLLRSSHIGILCSWQENYGLSVLEAQASGCPVITTDVQAMPEINDDGIGWLLSVPKDPMGLAVCRQPDERRHFAETLEGELLKTLTAILNEPKVIRDKGEKCIIKVRKCHSPHALATRLEAMWDQALSAGTDGRQL